MPKHQDCEKYSFITKNNNKTTNNFYWTVTFIPYISETQLQHYHDVVANETRR